MLGAYLRGNTNIPNNKSSIKDDIQLLNKEG